MCLLLLMLTALCRYVSQLRQNGIYIRKSLGTGKSPSNKQNKTTQYTNTIQFLMQYSTNDFDYFEKVAIFTFYYSRTQTHTHSHSLDSYSWVRSLAISHFIISFLWLLLFSSSLLDTHIHRQIPIPMLGSGSFFFCFCRLSSIQRIHELNKIQQLSVVSIHDIVRKLEKNITGKVRRYFHVDWNHITIVTCMYIVINLLSYDNRYTERLLSSSQNYARDFLGSTHAHFGPYRWAPNNDHASSVKYIIINSNGNRLLLESIAFSSPFFYHNLVVLKLWYHNSLPASEIMIE